MCNWPNKLNFKESPQILTDLKQSNREICETRITQLKSIEKTVVYGGLQGLTEDDLQKYVGSAMEYVVDAATNLKLDVPE